MIRQAPAKLRHTGKQHAAMARKHLNKQCKSGMNQTG